MDATDDRREEAQAWSLFHPREMKVASRAVLKHIKYLYDEKTTEIRGFQQQRRMYQDKISKMEQGSEKDGEETLVEVSRALAAVERDLREALIGRIKYCKDRITEYEDKLMRAENDRTHLFVSHNIRPSERETTLKQLKDDHMELKDRYKDELAKFQKVLETTEREVESLGPAIDESQEGSMVGNGDSNGSTEWMTLFDEASGAWYYYNTTTGESRWA